MSEPRRCASCGHRAHGGACLSYWGDAGHAEQCGCQWYEPVERRKRERRTMDDPMRRSGHDRRRRET